MIPRHCSSVNRLLAGSPRLDNGASSYRKFRCAASTACAWSSASLIWSANTPGGGASTGVMLDWPEVSRDGHNFSSGVRSDDGVVSLPVASVDETRSLTGKSSGPNAAASADAVGEGGSVAAADAVLDCLPAESVGCPEVVSVGRRIGAYSGSDSLPVEVAAVLGDVRVVTAPDEAAGVPAPSVGVSSTTLRFSPSADGADGVSAARTAGDVDAATAETAEEPLCSVRSCRRRRMRSDLPTEGASLSLASTAGDVESATTDTAEEPVCSDNV